MEEDFFLKNMRGVKPFKKDTSIIKKKITNKKNVKLDKKTKIYPGHDYLTNNLEFTLSLEPNNKDAFELLQMSKKQTNM